MPHADPTGSSGPDRLKRLYAQATLDYLRHARAGGAPNPEVWLDSHPKELRAALREFLRGLDQNTRPGVKPGELPKRWLAVLEAYRIDRTPAGEEVEYGRGGMGVVVKASDHLLGRSVAIKFLHPERRTDPHAVERFWAEARLQGELQHPGIPAVYQYGTDDTRGPFIVMQPVEGRPLNEILDAPSDGGHGVEWLSGIFLKVSEATAYAHQRGHSHRDIKPHNVKIGVNGQVWLMDWGTSRSGSGPDLENVPAGTPACAEGTPAYMAPEQARGDPQRDDKRTDVFLLGGLLCELLTGAPPYPGSQDEALRAARRGALGGAERRLRVREGDAPELVALALVCLRAVQAERPADASRVTKAVAVYRADVVRKKQEADADRRWERTKRRRTFAAVALVMVALAIGTIGTGLGWAQASREGYAKVAALKQAQDRLKRIEAAHELIASIFDDINPRAAEADYWPLADRLAARLDRAAEMLDGDAIGDDVVVAQLQRRLGRAYAQLGRPAKAVEIQLRAQKTLESTLGADHIETLSTLNDLALAYRADGRHLDAIDVLERTRGTAQQVLGPEHPDTLSVTINLAAAYLMAGRVTESTDLYTRARDALRTLFGATDRRHLAAGRGLASAELAAGRVAKAIVLLEEVREGHLKVSSETHSDVLDAWNDLASAELAAGRIVEATRTYEQIRDVMVRALGPNHPHTLTMLNNLATAYEAAGRVQDAFALYQRALDAQILTLGPNHPATLTTRNNLANAYRSVGRVAEAIRTHEQIRDIQLRVLGPNHPHTLASGNNLALAYEYASRTPAAVRLFEEIRTARMKVLGPDHPHTLTTSHNLADSYLSSGRGDDALKLHEEVFNARTRTLGPNHPHTFNSLDGVAQSLIAAGRAGEAIGRIEHLRPNLNRSLGQNHATTRTLLNTLAAAYLATRQTADAVRIFESVRDALVQALGEEHPDTLTVSRNLAGAYREVGRLPDAVRLYEKVRDIRKANPGLDRKETLSVLNDLGVAYLLTARPADAVPLLEEAREGFEALLGTTHPISRSATQNFLAALDRAGHHAAAAEVRSEGVAELKKRSPADLFLAGELAALGECWLKANRPSDAEIAFRECLSLTEKRIPDGWQNYHVKALLGRALLAQNELVEAEPLLLVGYLGMKKRIASIPPGIQSSLVEGVQNLIDLYAAFGDAERVARWRAERALYPPDRAPPPRLKK